MDGFIRKNKKVIVTAILSVVSTAVITAVFTSFSWFGSQLATPYTNKKVIKNHEVRIRHLEETHVPMSTYRDHLRKTKYDSLNVHHRLIEQDKKLDIIIRLLEAQK